MKGKGCLWDERCSKHLESLERLFFFYMGEVYIALVGEILTGAARGASLEGLGVQSVGQDTHEDTVHTIVLHYCTIVRLYH